MNSGTLTITGSMIAANTATGTTGGGDGAGIANTGILTIGYSTITDNTSASPVCDDCSSGAGIDNDGTLTLEWSTVSKKHAEPRRYSDTDRPPSTTLVHGNPAREPTRVAARCRLEQHDQQQTGCGIPGRGVGGITNSGTLHRTR